MTICEILKKWLKENGYDGLYWDGCGCAIGDLMPCGEPNEDCSAGIFQPCNCGGGCDFHLGPKPKLKRKTGTLICSSLCPDVILKGGASDGQ